MKAASGRRARVIEAAARQVDAGDAAEAQQVFINVVNRHKDEAITAAIQSVAGAFQGAATVTQILSDDITNAPYTYEARDTYAPKVGEVPASGTTLTFNFPAHSFTQIAVGVGGD